MKATCLLEWKGAFDWFGSSDNVLFRREERKLRGIYLWAVHVHNGYLTYYVGETGKTFNERMKEHASNYLSGLYRIYEPESFRAGRKVLLWQGMWQKGTQDLLPDFLERYSEYAPKILDMLGSLKLFVAPLDVEPRIRKRIESSIAHCLYNKSKPICDFQETEIRYARRSSSEEPFIVENVLQEDIFGLDKMLRA